MEGDGANKPTAAEQQWSADIDTAVDELIVVQKELDKINAEESNTVLGVNESYKEYIYKRRHDTISSIPHFWLTAFSSHPTLGEMLNEEDREIFNYVDSLVVEELREMTEGYNITFNFKANPFFNEAQLTKTIKFFDDGSLGVTGTPINWKAGKGLVDSNSEEKSFFSWFGNPHPEESVEVAELIKEDLWLNPIKYIDEETESESEDDDEI